MVARMLTRQYFPNSTSGHLQMYCACLAAAERPAGVFRIHIGSRWTVRPREDAMTHDPVWITGVGAVTPLGHRYADIAERLLAGVSGIRAVRAFSVADHPAKI